MKKSFEFTCQLDEFDVFDCVNITEEDSLDIVEELLRSDQIYVGKRTKGLVFFDDDEYPIVYNVYYMFCEELLKNDEWSEQMKVQVQL